MKKVSFIGIGLMGLPMAKRLLEGGLELMVWNRTQDKCIPLKESGALIAEELNTVADSEIIITMLADGQVVEEIVTQLLPSLTAEHLVIDMSSTSQKEVTCIAQKIESTGARFIDAPVSGGVKGAEEGTLAIMAGSRDEQTFEEAKVVFSSMGRATRVGDVGSGQLSKLANQAIVGGTIAIVAEAVLLLEQAGVDPEAFRRALSGGFADSTILQLHGKRMSERTFEPGGKVTTQLKDEKNILEAAQSFNLELPVTQAIFERYQDLSKNMGKGDLDHSALFLQLLKINNLG
jgi:2-hydroxy-3-oxopropionate reductase